METAKELLKRLLHDDGSIQFYLNRIEKCKDARELFDKVIVLLLASDSIAEVEARKQDFYMTLARAMEEANGIKVNKSTLHGYIDEHFNKIKKNDTMRDAQFHVQHSQDGVTIKISASGDGYIHYEKTASFTIKDKELATRLIQDAMAQGAVFTQLSERNFDVRHRYHGDTCQLECVVKDVPALLRSWQNVAGFGDLRFTCTTRLFQQEDLTLDETLEMLEA